jgi:transcriptional regulator with XRE-family HTH domain
LSPLIHKNMRFKSETQPNDTKLKSHIEIINSRCLRLLSGLCKYSHLDQSQIEQCLGYAKGYLSKIINGKLSLRVDHIVSICELLEFPTIYFWQIVHETETIELSRTSTDIDEDGIPHGYDNKYDNEIVRRMRGILIQIYSDNPDTLMRVMNHADNKPNIKRTGL